MQYAEIEPFGIDEADFRAISLNSLIAGIVGAKIPPESFALRHFVKKVHAQGESASVIHDEAVLDRLLGVRPRET